MPVDLSASFYDEYSRARKKAEQAERRGAFAEAASAHRLCAEWMRKYASCTHDAVVRSQRLQKADAHARAAEQLSNKYLTKPGKEHHLPPQPDAPTGEDDYEAEVTALIQKSKVTWDDIGGLEDTKNAIKSAYGLAIARKPKGVEINSWRNILLFGPPGTGKTILAAATAGSLDATFFNVKVSSLLSKYFGESTKLISALYIVARKFSPAVIFLDEFESLTLPRGSGESGAERRIVSTFLSELDGLETKDEEGFVLTIGATNVPWLLDAAILSRFQKRIYVPLPDEETRKAIFVLQLDRKGHQSKVPRDSLVRRTHGFSGREIEQLCQAAITRMTQRANPNLISVVDRGETAVKNYEIKVEALTEEDFKSAFEQVYPIANDDMLQHYQEWMEKVET